MHGRWRGAPNLDAFAGVSGRDAIVVASPERAATETANARDQRLG
jgi:hypothetical protein